MQVILFILLIAILIWLWPVFLGIAVAYSIYRLIRHIRKERYFKSDVFRQHRQKLSGTVKEYNEIAEYVNSFEEISLQASNSDRFKYADLANYENTSTFNINRDKNKKTISSTNVYQTSLSVVRKSSEEPLKYLCKYFGFKPNEENLIRIQEIGEIVSRFTNAKNNLDERLSKIEADFNPPKFILKHYHDELLKHLEVEIPKIQFRYPDYVFEYISAGGNSSQKTTIKLDENTIEALIEYIDENVKRSKTVKAQRALMTKKLREHIKKRDDYTCSELFRFYCRTKSTTFGS